MAGFGIGQPIRRVEDKRFLTGHGTYIEDITLPRQAYAVQVCCRRTPMPRSPASTRARPRRRLACCAC